MVNEFLSHEKPNPKSTLLQSKFWVHEVAVLNYSNFATTCCKIVKHNATALNEELNPEYKAVFHVGLEKSSQS
ncbi:hypothetical protein XNA1_2230007 [Xenorhabdus nematophila str. Anatoliense]|nr:hypothetical protein XNA1_2230007 [Xenorhabdus nematophila str. Anatoliense]